MTATRGEKLSRAPPGPAWGETREKNALKGETSFSFTGAGSATITKENTTVRKKKEGEPSVGRDPLDFPAGPKSSTGLWDHGVKRGVCWEKKSKGAAREKEVPAGESENKEGKKTKRQVIGAALLPTKPLQRGKKKTWSENQRGRRKTLGKGGGKGTECRV